jgi:hypothetical protein
MAVMERYCKAYPVKRFREFPGWTDKRLTNVAQEVSELGNEGYLFLQESLIVTKGVFTDEDIVFDQVTPEWEKFCSDELKFEAPADDVD